MQLVNFKRVAHPIIIVLVLAIALGNAPLAYAAQGKQKVSYYLYDHLGGVDKVTDEEGNVICSNDYFPFGDLRRGDCTENDEDYGFTGKEKDLETDLYYYGARYYDPMLGRFISQDPFSNALDTLSPQELQVFLSNPQNLNPYSYVKNNPLRYTDPTGQFEDDVHYALSYFLARQAGMSFEDSFGIANANQGMDEQPESNPFSSVEAREQYHFATQNQLKSLLNKAMATLDDKDIGTFFHANQDKYSHYDYGPLIGHFFGWIFPDKTWLTKLKVKHSDMMAKETFFYMRLFNRLKNGTNGLTAEDYDRETEEKWKSIEDRVHKFNEAKNYEEKMKKLYPELYQDKKSDKKK